MKRYSKNDWEQLVPDLLSGAVCAFCTDTVYGVGVLYGSVERLERLKHVKHRPESKPVPVMAASLDQLKEIAAFNEAALAIADRFLPGPLTLVVPVRPGVDRAFTNGLDSIAVRVPDAHPLLEVLERTGPLFVTSCNVSGEPPALCVEDVVLPGVASVLEGSVKEGVPSTIVDCTGDQIVVLRPGPVGLEELEGCLDL